MPLFKVAAHAVVPLSEMPVNTESAEAKADEDLHEDPPLHSSFLLALIAACQACHEPDRAQVQC